MIKGQNTAARRARLRYRRKARMREIVRCDRVGIPGGPVPLLREFVQISGLRRCASKRQAPPPK